MFEIKLRIRQSFTQKEIEVVNVRIFTVNMIFEPYDEWVKKDLGVDKEIKEKTKESIHEEQSILNLHQRVRS